MKHCCWNRFTTFSIQILYEQVTQWFSLNACERRWDTNFITGNITEQFVSKEVILFFFSLIGKDFWDGGNELKDRRVFPLVEIMFSSIQCKIVFYLMQTLNKFNTDPNILLTSKFTCLIYYVLCWGLSIALNVMINKLFTCFTPNLFDSIEKYCYRYTVQ